MNKGLQTLITAAGTLSVAALVWLLASGCNRPGGQVASESEEYHAENDIVMTIRSVSDAFEVNEPLSGSDYNFEGVLTDGAGMPLYTDIMGSPGQWQIQVINQEELRIHNLYLGDLLPENLEQYIAQSLELGTPVHNGVLTGPDGEEMKISEYELPGGMIRIETSDAKAPNGAEGPLMNITMRNRR